MLKLGDRVYLKGTIGRIESAPDGKTLYFLQEEPEVCFLERQLCANYRKDVQIRQTVVGAVSGILGAALAIAVAMATFL